MTYLTIPDETLSKAKSVHGEVYTYLGRKQKPVGNSGLFWFLTYECQKHGLVEQRQDGHLRGSGCPSCKAAESGKSQHLTFESFLQGVHEENAARYIYLSIKRKTLTKVYRSRTKSKAFVSFVCPEGHISEADAGNHMQKPVGCGVCNNRARSLEDFPDPMVKGLQVVREKLTLECECPEHGAFMTSAFRYGNLQGKSLCPKCVMRDVGVRATHSVEDALARINSSGTGLALVEESYTGIGKYARFTCPSGHVTEKPVAQVVSEQKSCSLCSSTVSSFNNEIANSIREQGFECVQEYKFSGNKSYDVFVPSLGLAIDYHGNIWHSTRFSKEPSRHLNRLREAERLGHTYIQIFSDEWRTKNSQVRSRILHLLGKSKKIGARKCIVEEITKAEASAFLDEHHIQGSASGGFLCLALKTKGVIVAVMVIGKNISARAETGNLELLRYASSVAVQGGLSKLISHLRQTLTGNTLITYSDRRLFMGGAYSRVGFRLVGSSRADYSYITASDDTRIHKSNMQKSRISSRYGVDTASKTETELTEALGFYRLYDCGKSKWELKL